MPRQMHFSVPRRRVQSRVQLGKPKDLQTSRLMNSTAHWVFQTRHPMDDHKRRVYRWTFLPLLFVDKALQQLSRLVFDFLPLLLAPTLAEIRTNLRTRTLSMQLLRESGGTFNEQFGTKSDDFVRAIATGRCRRAPAIARFDGPRVVFADDSVFTRSGDLLHGLRHKDALVSMSHGGTASRFILRSPPGFIDSPAAFGAIPPLAELQPAGSHWPKAGGGAAPKPGARRSSLTRFRSHFFRAVTGRLDHLVEYTPFCDELAARIGCKPTWQDIAARAAVMLHGRAVAAAQHGLVGPHAARDCACRDRKCPGHASASRSPVLFPLGMS